MSAASSTLRGDRGWFDFSFECFTSILLFLLLSRNLYLNCCPACFKVCYSFLDSFWEPLRTARSLSIYQTLSLLIMWLLSLPIIAYKLASANYQVWTSNCEQSSISGVRAGGQPRQIAWPIFLVSLTRRAVAIGTRSGQVSTGPLLFRHNKGSGR